MSNNSTNKFVINNDFNVYLKAIVEGNLEERKKSISNTDEHSVKEICSFFELNKIYTFIFENFSVITLDYKSFINEGISLKLSDTYKNSLSEFYIRMIVKNVIENVPVTFNMSTLTFVEAKIVAITEIKKNTIRMLTEEEIEKLQKDKRESYYKMTKVLERDFIIEKILERFSREEEKSNIEN